MNASNWRGLSSQLQRLPSQRCRKRRVSRRSVLPGHQALSKAVPVCWVWSVGVLFLLSCHSPVQPAARLESSRNLLILCIDTLRADHVGSYGYHRPTTPRIDRLATAGTLFLNARSHSSWTVPATASLLTSLLPSEHGAIVTGEIKNVSKENPSLQISEDVETLADILSREGFRTGLFSSNVHVAGRFARGFDIAEGRPLEKAGGLTEKALDWLSQDQTERFFLYFQFMDTHQPLRPPEPYFSYFEVADGNERGEKHEDWAFGRLEDSSLPSFQSYREHKIALYDGALRYLDSEVGKLLDTLSDRQLLEDTLVVITSDHGEEFWDHADIGREVGGDPRGIWGIGHGHSLFEELLHVPLIFFGKSIAQGKLIDCEIGQIDVAPTVLEFLAMDKSPQMKGRSLAKLLVQDSPVDECPEVPIIAESIAWGPDTKGVIWKQRKLIERNDGVTLLYDLRSDPDEMHNLAAELPEIKTGLQSLLAERGDHVERLGEPMLIDEERAEALRALGYIE